MASRNHTFQFRVDDAEREHLRKAAADAGYESASAYVRDAVLSRIVVVANHTGVVVTPGTETPAADDQRVLEAVTKAIEGLNGQEQDRGSGESAAAGTPAPPAAPPEPEPAPAPPAPGPAPASEAHPKPAGQPDQGVVGGGSAIPAESRAEPALGAPATSPGGGGDELVGSGASQSPAPGETKVRGREGLQAAPGELEPGGPGACPGCGGTEGRHQSFCEHVTGEPPVAGTEAPTELPEPDAAAVIETHEEFVARRVAEGETSIVAEAEWRQKTSGQAPAVAQAAPATCATCGTMKASALHSCPDCGALPVPPVV